MDPLRPTEEQAGGGSVAEEEAVAQSMASLSDNDQNSGTDGEDPRLQGVDMTSFPVLRIDHISRLPNDVLRQAQTELGAMISRGEIPEGFEAYAQKQMTKMREEEVNRAAADRVLALIEGRDVGSDDVPPPVLPEAAVQDVSRSSSAFAVSAPTTGKVRQIQQPPVQQPPRQTGPYPQPQQHMPLSKPTSQGRPPRPPRQGSASRASSSSSSSSRPWSGDRDGPSPQRPQKQQPEARSPIRSESSGPTDIAGDADISPVTLKQQRRASRSRPWIRKPSSGQKAAVDAAFGKFFVVAAVEPRRRFRPRKVEESDEDKRERQRRERRESAMDRLAQRRQERQEQQRQLQESRAARKRRREKEEQARRKRAEELKQRADAVAATASAGTAAVEASNVGTESRVSAGSTAGEDDETPENIELESSGSESVSGGEDEDERDADDSYEAEDTSGDEAKECEATHQDPPMDLGMRREDKEQQQEEGEEQEEEEIVAAAKEGIEQSADRQAAAAAVAAVEKAMTHSASEHEAQSDKANNTTDTSDTSDRNQAAEHALTAQGPAKDTPVPMNEGELATVDEGLGSCAAAEDSQRVLDTTPRDAIVKSIVDDAIRAAVDDATTRDEPGADPDEGSTCVAPAVVDTIAEAPVPSTTSAQDEVDETKCNNEPRSNAAAETIGPEHSADKSDLPPPPQDRSPQLAKGDAKAHGEEETQEIGERKRNTLAQANRSTPDTDSKASTTLSLMRVLKDYTWRYTDYFPNFESILCATQVISSATGVGRKKRSMPPISSSSSSSSSLVVSGRSESSTFPVLPVESLHAELCFQLQLYKSWLEVMHDFSTVFALPPRELNDCVGGEPQSGDEEASEEGDVARPANRNQGLYSGKPSSLHYRVNSSRAEVYHIVADVLDREMAEERPWFELPDGFGLKTTWNLLWTWSKPRIQHSKLLAWQRLNHFPNARFLTRKDMLKRQLAAMEKKLGGWRGNAFRIMPNTFVLPHEYTAFVSAFMAAEGGMTPAATQPAGSQGEEAEGEGGSERKRSTAAEAAAGATRASLSSNKPVPNLWIMKPVALSRGRGVSVVADLGQVTYSDPVVVQQYVSRPLLLDDYKFDLRIYVVVTSFQPLEAFVYREGFARLSTEKYTVANSTLGNKLVHLTNSSIQMPNKDQIPPDHPVFRAKSSEAAGTKTTLTYLWARLRERDVDTQALWDSIVVVILKSLVCVEDEIDSLETCFELFGYDVIIDEDLKPWLLEVNASPSLGRQTQLDVAVKNRLVHDIVELVGCAPFDREALVRVLARRVDELEERHPHLSGRRGKKDVGTAGGSRRRSLVQSARQSAASSPGSSRWSTASATSESGSASQQQLEDDLHDILRGFKPRRAGETPERVGLFERMAPGTQAHKTVLRLKHGKQGSAAR